MKDTPDFIMKKQFEIVMSKPIAQRLLITDEMIGLSRKLAIQRIKSQYPDLPEAHLKFLLIKEYYQNDLPPQQLDDIKHKLCNL
jgi:hypothetical protein